MAQRFAGASAALLDRRAAVIERWLTGYGRSLLRLPRSVDPRELHGIAETIADALGAALAEPGCAPGASSLREVEKRVAFAGGSLGMSGASAFDVAAFFCALRDVLAENAADAAERDALRGLCDWFCALACEGCATSRQDALRLRHRDSLERGTPVVMLTPELPAAFLVGEPDRSVLDSIFGRLLLAVVRVGARALVVDAAGLLNAGDPPVLDALGVFGQHRKVAGKVSIVLSGLPAAAEADWRGALAGEGTEIFAEERFEDAFERALAAAGLEIGKKRGS